MATLFFLFFVHLWRAYLLIAYGGVKPGLDPSVSMTVWSETAACVSRVVCPIHWR